MEPCTEGPPAAEAPGGRGPDGQAAAARRAELADWVARHKWGTDRWAEVRELGFQPRGPIRVNVAPVGGILVTGWDHDEVHVEARVLAHAPGAGVARALVDAVRVEASAEGVRAFSTARRAEGSVVTLVMRVPRHTDLSLAAVTGPVSVEGVSGRMRLETMNGPLTLVRVAGDVRGRTRCGPVHVTLDGARWEGEGLDAETLGGPSTLELPAGYSARLETGTLSGPALEIHYPLPLPAPSARRVRTQTGEGGASVRVVTRAGPAMLRMARAPAGIRS
jgi:hypothetical protein